MAMHIIKQGIATAIPVEAAICPVCGNHVDKYLMLTRQPEILGCGQVVPTFECECGTEWQWWPDEEENTNGK